MGLPIKIESNKMIIDAHAHLVALASLYSHRSTLIVAGGDYGNSSRAKVAVADLRASADENVRIMDGVGTDIQLLSPRRSEWRRLGKDRISTCRNSGSQYHKKKKQYLT